MTQEDWEDDMSYEHTTTTTVAAPANFVRAFILDVENWPRLRRLPTSMSQQLWWEGAAWEPGSTLVTTSVFTGRKTTVRAIVAAREAGELYRTMAKMAGTRVWTTCRVGEAGTDAAVVSYQERIDGWMSLAGKMAAGFGGGQFYETALQSAIALAWLQSHRAGAASPRQDAAASLSSEAAP